MNVLNGEGESIVNINDVNAIQSNELSWLFEDVYIKTYWGFEQYKAEAD
jgi:hypothetical protein